jgi:PKD repeat protein
MLNCGLNLNTQMKIIRPIIFACLCVVSLSAVGQGDQIEQIRESISKKYTSLKPADISELVITDAYTSHHSKVQHVYASQSINGIRVLNSHITAAFDASGDVRGVNACTYSNIASKAPSATPGLGLSMIVTSTLHNYAPQIQAFVNELESGTYQIDFSGPNYSHTSKAKLVYWVSPEEEVHLAYVFDLDMPSGKHWWQFVVDANSGNELKRFDWQVTCATEHLHTTSCVSMAEAEESSSSVEDGSGYNVFSFPTESPSHGDRVIVAEPAFSAASPFGWHDVDGIPGADFTITRGNNVYAYEDINDVNEPGFSPDGGAELDFDFPLELNAVPATYTPAATTNLFYANNRIHDILYVYGFDEESGNFQQNNYGNGGEGQDWVRAEAQDGGGTNNANMATPPDGNRPRMQMYLWTAGGASISLLNVNSPEAISGNYPSTSTAAFGPGLPTGGITADMAIAEDVNGNNELCGPAGNATELNGKIVIVDRGSCNFTEKVLNAQAAGALAVVVVNNVAGGVNPMGGTAPGITIPSFMITQADGNTIKDVINDGIVVNATLGQFGDGSGIKDGSFDNGIIVHEYVHGLSNRLTGGPSETSCLGNEEQMGEGWSDWYCLMLTMDINAANPQYRPIGTFATSEPITGNGIRPVPYDTSFTVNNYTYADVSSNSLSVPHGVGFVWSTMLWDLTWALIEEYGYDPDLYSGTSGNNIALQLVTDALKLQVCEPGFVDGRDAILLADELYYEGANNCLIWKVFARRGLGFSAEQGSSQSRSDGIAAFDLPPTCQNVIEGPTAIFEISELISCNGLISFTDLSTNIPQEWLWDFGDGNTSNEQNPTHQYTEEGTYEVSLTVTNILGEDISVAPEPIVFELPEGPVAGDDVEGCAGSMVSLNATSPVGEVMWYDADNNYVGMGNTVDVTLGETSSFYTAKSLVAELPSVYAGPEDSSIGIGNFHNTAFTGTVDFEAFESLVIASAWVNSNVAGPRMVHLFSGISGTGDTLQSVLVNIDFVGTGRVYIGLEVDAPGLYSFGLNQAGLFRNNGGVSYPYSDDEGMMSIIGSSGGEQLYYYFYDIEVAKPYCLSEGVDVLATLTGNTNFEFESEGLQVSFSGNASTAGWAWDFGDGNTSSEQNPVHTYAEDGTYTVSLATSDGCSRSKEVSVEMLVSVFDEASGDGFSMVPNPASSWIRISAGSDGAKDADVLNFYNVSGQLVKTIQLQQGQTEWLIELSSFADGFYTASIHNEQGQSVYREKLLVLR